MADLDLWRGHAAGEIRARSWMGAAARRSVRWSPAAASSRVRRSGIRCCSPACTRIPLPCREHVSCCPMSTSAAPHDCAMSSSIAACRIPEGLVVGEDPQLDAERFRRTEQGICLITQDDARPIEVMRPLDVLAVVSEIFPLIKTGGLADVAGALPGALAAEGVVVRSLVPGYPAGTGRPGRRRGCRQPGRSVRRRGARRCGAVRSGLDLFVIDAPHLFLRDGDPYRGPDGRDWPDNAFRFAALVTRRRCCSGRGW